MPGSYVDNASNRRLGRVGMPLGSMPVSRGSSGLCSVPKTYVDNAFNRREGRVGLEHGTAVISKSSSLSSESYSPKIYVDNAFNRREGRVGLEHGTAVISKSSSWSPESYSPKIYVDNAFNRREGRVGLEQGTAVISKSSSLSSESYSPKIYVDNAFNRSVERVGLEHGTAVISKLSSSASDISSPQTYVDNDFNRRVGRVGLEHGTAVISKSSSSASEICSSQTYVEKDFKRRVGRVGLEHGTAVILKSPSLKLYVDDTFIQALERVGILLGSMTGASGKSSTISGSPGRREESKSTLSVKILSEDYHERPEEGIDLEPIEEDSQYVEDASAEDADSFNRIESVWHQESQKIKEPLPSSDLKRYYGNRIEFDELDITKQIGHGGFGDVYCAKLKGALVAVKKIRVQRVSKKQLQRFASEVQVFCALDHPNIVKFIGACCVTPNIAIVMEFMESCLFRLLHMPAPGDAFLTDDEKLSIIVQIARGLAYLHNKSIAHCDVKSRNVLIDSRGGGYLAKITDFGLGMMKCGSDQVRNIGTPRYSAPEVLRGEPLDRAAMMRTDVYSLGLVVFEIISEEEPFDSLNAKQIEWSVGHGDLSPVFGTDVDENLEEDVKECWSRDPLLRPSASLFRDSVELWETLYM